MCLCLWWSTCVHVEAANDSLKSGDNTYTLCSKKFKYCLSFSSIVDNQEDQYLMEFNANDNMLVWVGNREEPVNQSDDAVLP